MIIMYLVPLAVILVTGFALMTGRRVGLPDRWNDFLLDNFDRLKRRFSEVYARIANRSRNAGGKA